MTIARRGGPSWRAKRKSRSARAHERSTKTRARGLKSFAHVLWSTPRSLESSSINHELGFSQPSIGESSAGVLDELEVSLRGDELAKQGLEGGVGMVKGRAAGGDVGGLESVEDGSQGDG